MLAQHGNAHHILKKDSKPRLKKKEAIELNNAKEVEKGHIHRLLQAEATLSEKKIKIEDAISVIEEHERMRQYLKDKGLMEESGQMRV